MNASLIGPLGRAAYALGQGARVGLFWGQYLLSARLTTPVKAPRPIEGPFPDRQRILADLRALLARDLANIEAGFYRLPHDLIETPARALAQARAYFAELREVERRRHARAHDEVLNDEALREARRDGRYPRYYLQNFHYQSGGWLSRRSAALYDHQVEVLFGGGADAMRRMALVPLHDVLKQRRVAETRLIDLASGTGRFLSFVKDNYPRLAATALDLSPAYLEEAQRQLKPWRGIDYVNAAAEATGLPDASFDLVTCVFLFHELPRKVRRQVAAEAFRILKPGGRFILVDSIQQGDVAGYDGLLDYFPVAFHEPYYADYVRDDLHELFESAGFTVISTDIAYFARLMVMEKRAPGS
jgi:ubiquinone/menaquinone biosynthesis C-methylase UbiE